MPIPWLVVLKSVPWTDVISNAPKVVDGAKKLWNTVSKRSPEPAAGSPDRVPPAPAADADADGIAQLRSRVAAMASTSAALHEQMLASSALIQSLADQNAQLIRHIEDHRVRLKWLTRALLAVGGIAVLALILALAG